jgi:hypothetical protein
MIEVEQIGHAKWLKLTQLSDAIVRQQKLIAEHPTQYNAAELQHLEQQRSDLRATVGFAVIIGGKKDPTFRKVS